MYFHFVFQVITTDSQIMVSKFLYIESSDASTVNEKINENGETELHLAAAQNMKLSALSLIKIGADANAVCNLGKTKPSRMIIPTWRISCLKMVLTCIQRTWRDPYLHCY